MNNNFKKNNIKDKGKQGKNRYAASGRNKISPCTGREKICNDLDENGYFSVYTKEVFEVAVVGGGAAGMMAAIEAARAGARVLLIERNPGPGKKLATTGNGRCNFTNLDMEDLAGGKYRGENPKFAEQALEIFSPEKTIEWFREIGIEPKYRGTYVYPNSDQAASVVAALFDEVKNSGRRCFLTPL